LNLFAMSTPPMLQRASIYVFGTQNLPQLPTSNHGVPTKEWRQRRAQKSISILIAGLMAITIIIGFIASFKNAAKWKKKAEIGKEIQTIAQVIGAATFLSKAAALPSIGLVSEIVPSSITKATSYESGQVEVVTSRVIIHPTVTITLTASAKVEKRGSSATGQESPTTTEASPGGEMNPLLLPGPAIVQTMPSGPQESTFPSTNTKATTSNHITLSSTKLWKHGYHVDLSNSHHKHAPLHPLPPNLE
jgi:hypothetical protein